MQTVYVNTGGQVATIKSKLDLTGISSVSVLVKKPDDTVVEIPGVVAQPPSSGLYTVQFPVGTWDQLGEYRVQGKVTGGPANVFMKGKAVVIKVVNDFELAF